MTALPRESRGFALFAETLRIGLLVALFGLAVVTLVPAVAAGTSHMRRFLRGEADTARAYLADFHAALHDLWVLGVGSVLAGLLLFVNAVALASGAVPGAIPMGLMTALVAVAGSVVVLRAAALWNRDVRRDADGTERVPRRISWLDLVRRAAQRAYLDMAGSALIAMAIGVCVVLVWMLTPLAVVVPGLVVFAVVAIEQRALRADHAP